MKNAKLNLIHWLEDFNWPLFVVIVACVGFLAFVCVNSSASPIAHKPVSAVHVRQSRRILTRADARTDRAIRIAARLAIQNKVVAGLKILAQQDEAALTPNELDLLRLTKARLLAQAGDLDLAIKNYDAIHSGSPYWLDSIEEKGEVTAREKHFAKAIAILQTAFAPQFKNKVHPSTFFVASLTHLKICDFAGVFTVSQQFKSNIESRLPDWRAQAAKGDRYARAMIAEATSAMHDLQIIEADVIQRMALADKAANGPTMGKINKSEDVLRFPVTDSPNQEVWRDELGHYAAEVKSCPAPHLTVSRLNDNHGDSI